MPSRSSASNPDLYRQAGDRCSTEEGDLASALRCYGQALDAAPDQVAVNPQDNWLLIALKQARQKENQFELIALSL